MTQVGTPLMHRVEKIKLWRSLSIQEKQNRICEFADPLYIFGIPSNGNGWRNQKQTKEARDAIICDLLSRDISENLRVFLMSIQDNDSTGLLTISPLGSMQLS